jgi:aminoglycoside phosphotransferase (APT) family kinase protein
MKDSLAAPLRDWIEQTTGGVIAAATEQGRWRPQWFVDVDTADGLERLVLRMARTGAEAPTFEAEGSTMSLAAEAAVLGALQDTRVPVPRVRGFEPTAKALLMQRLEGTAEPNDEPDQELRRQVLAEWAEGVAMMHDLDPARLDLPHLANPSTSEEVALGSDFAESINAVAQLGHLFGTADPLLQYAAAWLKNHVPKGPSRLSLVQGDSGPGQFMFKDGHLTGLIDWELARLGDPARDLGCARMRDTIYHMGGVNEAIAHYEEFTSSAVDRDAVRFYTTYMAFTTPASFCLAAKAPTTQVGFMTAFFGWDATLRRVLCESLLEVHGLPVPPPPELPAARTTSRSALHDYLVEHLRDHWMASATDERSRFYSAAGVAIADALRLAELVGAQADDDELSDLGGLLGKPVTDLEHALREVAAIVENDPVGCTGRVLPVFYVIARRREMLAEPLMIAQTCEALKLLPGS